MGVAGFIAKRHLQAIRDTNNMLVAALDRFDCVGIMDSYFPEADFFVEYERFDRHMDKLRRQGRKIDYVSICTPNYLHDSHIRFALKQQADAICEKPLVLNPWNVDALMEMEKETGKRVYNILQLRYHPAIIALREKVLAGPADKVYDIDLSYITSRGNWYFISWKSDIQKSGGIATNIGVHFFDMLSWIFGEVQENVVHLAEPQKMAGFLRLRQARVRWFLSLDYSDVPETFRAEGKRTFRQITVNREPIEFSEGFGDLHTATYKKILEGEGYGLEEVRPAIEMVYQIRNAQPLGLTGDFHPMAKKAE